VNTTGLIALDPATGARRWARDDVLRVRVQEPGPGAVSGKHRTAYTHGVVTSPDGERVATLLGVRRGLGVQVWVGRTADGGDERVFDLPPDTSLLPSWPYAPALTWVPSGRTLAVTAGSAVTLCDAGTGAVSLRLTGHVGQVQGLAFSDDGSRVFVYSGEFPAGASQLTVWDMASGRKLLEIPLPPEQRDGNSGSKPVVQRLGQPLFRDGKVYVTTSEGVRVFDGSPIDP
jgi:WD40 repeat protein